MIMYRGPAVIKGINRDFHLSNVELRQSAQLYETATGTAPGLREWYGTSRMTSMQFGLLDILGTEARIVLSDGRDGICYITGCTEDSAWILQIQGVGPPPWESR